MPMKTTDSPRRSPRLAGKPTRTATSPARRRHANGVTEANDVESPKPPEDKYTGKQTGLAGDWGAIALLLLLYTLQGIPMGLGGL